MSTSHLTAMERELMKPKIWARIVIAVALLALSAFAATTYHLVSTYKFGAAKGGREYFDYMTFDSGSRRLYLSHGTEVLVVNADSGKEEGKISGLKLSHGVAVIPELGRGFISDGADSKAIIFDLKTLKIVGEAIAAPDADCIIYDPASKHVFTFNGDSHNATAIDPATGQKVGVVDLGGGPEFAVADGHGTIYNNLEDKSEVLAIDSLTLRVKSRWPIAPAGAPESAASGHSWHLSFACVLEVKARMRGTARQNCQLWPHSVAAASSRQPIQTQIPTMFVSGDSDGGTQLWFTEHAPGFPE